MYDQRCRDDYSQIKIGKNVFVDEEDTGMKLDMNASKHFTKNHKYKENQAENDVPFLHA